MIFTLLGEDHLENFGRTKEKEPCKINVSTHCLVPEFFFSFKRKLCKNNIECTVHLMSV